MIEVVTEKDLDNLADTSRDRSRVRQRAIGILLEIVGRLPRPRAYVCEPAHELDENQVLLWVLAHDILTATLRWDEHTGVVEAQTIRDLALFCPALDNLTTAIDPLWQTLASSRLVDRVYIPADGLDSKRRIAMRRHAEALCIEVVNYRPIIEKIALPRISPPNA